MAKRMRVKVFSAWHSAVIEKQINKWIASWERKGFVPVIFAKETRITPSDGKLGICISLLYRLEPLSQDDPTLEVDMDAE